MEASGCAGQGPHRDDHRPSRPKRESSGRHRMNSSSLHIYAALDESRESALAGLAACLQQQGREPTVRPLPSDDQVKVVAEMEQQLFGVLCQALEAWIRRPPGIFSIYCASRDSIPLRAWWK